MKISNVPSMPPLKSSRDEVMIRWPVEEIGRNSEIPSTTPRIMTLIHSDNSSAPWLQRGIQGVVLNVRPRQCGGKNHLARRTHHNFAPPDCQLEASPARR